MTDTNKKTSHKEASERRRAIIARILKATPLPDDVYAEAAREVYGFRFELPPGVRLEGDPAP